MAVKMILVLLISLIFTSDFGNSMSDLTEVEIIDYPYQVGIEYKRMFQCSGAILNPIWVVTAAQCLKDLKIEDIKVRGGTKIRKILGEEHYVLNIILHPEYDQETFDNDIGLIQLADPFTSANTRGIPIAAKAPIRGTIVTLTGWGAPTTGTWLATNLLKSEIPMVYWMDCLYNYKGLDRPITGNMICAGEKGNGACGGDTGEPLTYNNELIGIMSWSYGCGERKTPAVFTAVSNYADWINGIIS